MQLQIKMVLNFAEKLTGVVAIFDFRRQLRLVGHLQS
jgi:hypothetical protein